MSENTGGKTWLKWSIPSAIILLIALLPIFNPDIYYLSFGVMIFMYIALCGSWNILGGFSGYASFGHAVFFGIGAYTVALLLINFGYSPFLTCFVGGIVAGIFSLIIGFPVLRLKGPYFSIATLCLTLATVVIVINLPSEFTGGPAGLFLPLMPADIFASRAIFYESMLILAIAVTLLSRAIQKSKFGIGLISIRENETTAETIGVNSTQLKILAFVLSAFLAGVIGGIYAYYRTYVHPDTVFDPFLSIAIVIMAILGGAGTWQGPIIGAVILTVIDQVLIAVFPGLPAEVTRVIFGLIIIFVIMYMPSGIMHFINIRFRSRLTN